MSRETRPCADRRSVRTIPKIDGGWVNGQRGYVYRSWRQCVQQNTQNIPKLCKKETSHEVEAEGAGKWFLTNQRRLHLPMNLSFDFLILIKRE